MYYNYQRIHGSLAVPSIELFCEREHKALFEDEMFDVYDPKQERFHERDYADDQRMVHATKVAR